MTSFRCRRNRRTGAAAVEFAIVAPVMFAIFFASVEFSRANMLRHTIDIAAYEGARQGILPGATAADVQDRVNEALAQVAIRNANVTLTPSTITPTTPQVTVQVSAPMNGNGFIFSRFTTGSTVSGECTLAREGYTGG